MPEHVGDDVVARLDWPERPDKAPGVLKVSVPTIARYRCAVSMSAPGGDVADDDVDPAALDDRLAAIVDEAWGRVRRLP